MVFANFSIYYTWKNIKSEYSNNKFKILAPTLNNTFDLPDGSSSTADIQDYCEFIIKKHETLKFTHIKSKTELFSKQKPATNLDC